MNFKWLLLLLLLATQVDAQSYYPLRLDDPKAVYLTPENFPVHADGITDDTEALQFAINKVQETTGEGIVFVPSGRYRLTTTVYVWGGIRVIGFGPTRPMLVLTANTPGYTDKSQEKYMVFFSGSRRGARPAGAAATAPDTNPRTRRRTHTHSSTFRERAQRGYHRAYLPWRAMDQERTHGECDRSRYS